MSDISTGMKVTGLSQYKSAMQQAQQSVRTLDAQLKKTEAQYKATGDKEQYMSDKSDTLKKKLNEQQKAASNAQKALEQMKKNGVDPTSVSYQKMEQQLLKAQTGVLQTTAEINNLTVSEQEAAKGADQLTTSVNGISRKISLDQVISGVNSITSGLENAAKKAVDLGKAIAEAVLDGAARSDNIATMASILGMDIEDYQRYQKVFDTVADITVTDWRRAQDKIRKAMTSPTDDQKNVLRLLGVDKYTLKDGGGVLEPVLRDVTDVFWDVGMALRRDVASGKLTMLEADDMANLIFGKNWANLNPLFDNFTRETFADALKDQNVQSEESVKRLADLNDTVIKLKGDLQSLQDEVLSGMAPALTEAAKVLDQLLGKLMDYLQSEDGQKMLEGLSESISTLFEDLGKIDPESVVNNFTNVFNAVISSLQWLVENKDTVVGALEGIVVGWGALKLTGGALELYKLIQGITGLAGGAAAAAQAGTAAGASWGAAFAKSAMAAAPWLAGLITLLTPAKGGNDDLIDSNGRLTETAKGLGYTLDNNGQIVTNRKPGRSELTLDEIVANALEGTKKQPITIDLTYGNKPVSTMGSAGQTMALLDIFTGGKQEVDVPVVPETPDDAADQIAAQIGTVKIGARIVPISLGGGPGGSGLGVVAQLHANGLPFVPFDGYPAILHKGERVMTAEANRQYTTNSNLYIENMNMSNGMDAQALVDIIDRQNRRKHAGFGY